MLPGPSVTTVIGEDCAIGRNFVCRGTAVIAWGKVVRVPIVSFDYSGRLQDRTAIVRSTTRDGPGYFLHLRVGHLGVDGQAQYFFGRGFGGGQASLGVSGVAVGGLEVDGSGVVD